MRSMKLLASTSIDPFGIFRDGQPPPGAVYKFRAQGLCLLHGRGQVSEVFYGSDRDFVGSSAMALRLSVSSVASLRLGSSSSVLLHMASSGLVSIGVASSCLVASCARSWPLSRQGAWHPPVSRLVPQAGCVRLSPPSGCSSSCVTCELGLFCFSSVVWSLRDTSREYCGNCQLSSCVFLVVCFAGSGLGFASPVCFPVGSFPVACVVISLVCELTVLLFRSSVA